MTDPMHADPANWTRGPLKPYFNREDRWFWVRKHSGLGWTFDLAHRATPFVVLAIVLAPAVVRFLH